MRVYIATRFYNKGEFHVLKNLLEAEGILVTHDWTKDDVESVPPEEKKEYLAKCAIECIRGVAAAHLLILIDHPGMKGAFVEMGMAIGSNTPVLVIGAEVNDESPIFYHLPQNGLFAHAKSIESAAEILIEGWREYKKSHDAGAPFLGPDS